MRRFLSAIVSVFPFNVSCQIVTRLNVAFVAPAIVQIASAPVSPVRMRMASSTLRTKILPSPMRPVRAAFWIASIGGFQPVFVDDDFDFHLGQEIHDIFGAAIEFGMALLAAEALGLGHRDALDADFLQRFLHFVELERLDDGFDLFHACSSARA